MSEKASGPRRAQIREPVPAWRRELAPFGDLWWQMEQAILALLEPMDDGGLRQIIEDCAQPDSRNCWYAVHDVAPHVAEEARRILYARECAAKEASR